ncbi:MAG: 4Fe-4S binding protein, partial [Rectinemataceae bacterium]|nr:4Fe-4S binding protein [Rectinemataceae bacterium]
CVGCMTCTSVCSKLYFKEENPAKSTIMVNENGAGRFHLVACDQECGACVRECPVKAISVNKNGIVVIDKRLCVGCLACVAVCPINAMRWYPGNPTPFKCISCGACARACPKAALEVVNKEPVSISVAAVSADKTGEERA